MVNNKKIELITSQIKKIIERKYKIIDIRLIGSSARGDNKKDSDIDIFIRLPKVNRIIEEKFILIKYRLERADESLKAASIMLENNMYIPAINRIYYSMFYSI
jgi:predicted nucleotidyltransferase